MIQKRFFFCFAFISSIFLCGIYFVQAQEFTSANYKSNDSAIYSGGYGTSTNFQVFGVLGQISAGTSTSPTSFGNNAGFLFFPFASSPVVSATAGNASVALSWTASTGFVGWTVSTYAVGQATISGGPYAYSSVGAVTSSNRTGLSNGTTYYFVIVARDTFGNNIATSTQVSATPVAPSPSPSPSSGGGGGGGGGVSPTPVANMSTQVIIKGRAFPGANITLFKDGSTVATPDADLNGNWEAGIPVVGGIYTFSVYAVDKDNHRSLTTSFTTNVIPGQITTISDSVLPPTVGADKSQVKSGNDIKFFGYGYPQSQVNIVVNSEVTILEKTNSDKFGFWSYILNSKVLELGDHTSKSQIVTRDALISPFSESLSFRVGDKDVAFGKVNSIPLGCSKNGDLNNDGKVNIIDFSVLLFFWNQKNPKNVCADINKDGIVSIFDFSVMLYWWNG